MIFWALVALASVGASEAFMRLPILSRVRKIAGYAAKSGRLLRSPHVSDHWKERILPVYALRIGVGSVVMFLTLCGALLPVLLVGLLYPGGLAGWGEALVDPLTIVVMTVLSISYIWIRLRLMRNV